MKVGRVAIFAVLGLGFAAHAQEEKDEKKSPLRVAVVNLKKCFDGYDHARILPDYFQKQSDEGVKKLESMREKVEELRKTVGGLDRGTDIYVKKSTDLAAAEKQFQTTEEQLSIRLRLLRAKLMGDLFNEVQRAVNSLAHQEKYDLVLRAEEPQVDDDPRNIEQRILNRTLLYAADGMDITTAVLKRVNEEWGKKKWTCGKCSLASLEEKKCPGCGTAKP